MLMFHIHQSLGVLSDTTIFSLYCRVNLMHYFKDFEDKHQSIWQPAEMTIDDGLEFTVISVTVGNCLQPDLLQVFFACTRCSCQISLAGRWIPLVSLVDCSTSAPGIGSYCLETFLCNVPMLSNQSEQSNFFPLAAVDVNRSIKGTRVAGGYCIDIV